MEFQKRLLDVANALSEEEVNALVFLCTDLLNQNLKSVKSASDLFSKLIDQDRLSAEDPQLLTELLSTIQRHRLLRGLHLPSPECRTRRLISPYRTLLYHLSEEITAQDLKNIKFMLGQEVPRRKLEEHVTTLEIFLEMERRDLISDTNLNKLEDIFRSVHPALHEKINRFKEQQAHEMGRPRSSSVPSTSNPSLGSIRSTGSFDTADLPASRTSINSASTSLDKRTDKCEPETHGIGSLVIAPSQENNASAETKNETLGTYPMASAKRGICAIVNNYDFSKSQRQLGQREGTMVDEKSLRTVFEWLGFQVLTYTDCDGGKILSVLRELSKRDHSQMDCLVVCVLSHGHQGKVYGVDGQAVALEDLTEPFDGPKCHSLAGKPKLFFIQACQGNKEQRPVEIDGDLCADARPNKDFIPSGADFLLGMATVPSYVSFRDKKTGTWYIQSLCQNLVQMVPSQLDLVSILTKVNADVSRMSDPHGQKKQMPQPAFTLRQKVVFPIPKDPPPSLQD